MAPDDENGWGEYGKHVVSELERLSAGQESLREEVAGLRVDMAQHLCRKCPFDREEITAIRVEVASQKVRTGILASIFGTLSGVIASLIAFLVKS